MANEVPCITIIDSDDELERPPPISAIKRTPALVPAPAPPLPALPAPSISSAKPQQAALIRSFAAAPAASSSKEQPPNLALLPSAQTVSPRTLSTLDKSDQQSNSIGTSGSQIGCKNPNNVETAIESLEVVREGAIGWKGKGRQENVEQGKKSWTTLVINDSSDDDLPPPPRLNPRPTKSLNMSPIKPSVNYPLFGLAKTSPSKIVKDPLPFAPNASPSKDRTNANAQASTSNQQPAAAPLPRPVLPLPRAVVPAPLPPPPVPPQAAVLSKVDVLPPRIPSTAGQATTPTRPRRETGNYEEGSMRVNDTASFLLAARANALKNSPSPIKPNAASPSKESKSGRLRGSLNKPTTESPSKSSSKGKAVAPPKTGKRKKKNAGLGITKRQRKALLQAMTDPLLKAERARIIKLTKPLPEAEHAIALEKCLAREKSKMPWARSIAGPSFEGEFDAELQNYIYHSRRGSAQSLPGDTMLFQSMIDEVLAHNRGTGTVTICANPDGPYSPPFEFNWTDRVIYPPSILPVPPPSCYCIGACSNALNSTCACWHRQTEMSRTRYMGVERSNLKGFAYDSRGLLRTDFDEPIHECGAGCSCDETCQNRQMSKGVSVDIELFWAGMAGWAVRNGPHKMIRTGQCIGTYAGELLKPVDGNVRYKKFKAMTGRLYIFSLSNWSIEEALKGPDMENNAHVAEDEIDAFFYGNFTRFLNHRCVPNVVIRILYLDDADPRRPSFVFVAKKNIPAGEEMSISYFSSEDPSLEPGETLKEYQANAIETRMNATKGCRCYCGEELCRGVTFAQADVQDGGDDSSDTNEEEDDEE